MTEHIGRSPFYEPHAVIIWQFRWYCIPFMVLEDILNDMIKQRKPGTKELGSFLNGWKYGWFEEQPLELLKPFLEPEMPGMEAYLLYDVN